MEYGFSINVSGNSVAQMKQIEGQLQRLGITARETGKDAAKAMEPFEDKLKDLAMKLGELFAVREVFNFGKEILNVTAEFEGFENRVKFASLNTYDAGQNTAFLREEIEKLHMPMRQAYEGFSEMQAGLVGTGIEGERLRTLFDGIATAAATLHLPEYQLQRTLYDLKEIGEIGINMRVARSLSTALPGINGIVKEAFGKGLRELEKDGISGGEFLSRLGPALKKHFESGIANWGESLQAKMQDLKNASIKEMLELGDKLRPVFIDIMGGIEGAFNSAPVRFFTTHIAGIVSVLEKVIPMWIAYKGVMILVNSAMTETGILFRLIEGLQMTVMFGFEGLTVAAESFGVTLQTIGIGVFAAGIALVVENMMAMNKEVDEWAEKMTGLKESMGTIGEANKEFGRVNTAFAGHGQMSGDEKQELYRDLQNQLKNDSAKLHSVLEPLADKSKKAEDNGAGPVPSTGTKSGRFQYAEWLMKTEKLKEAAIASKDNVVRMREDLVRLQSMSNQLIKEGFKPLKGLPALPPGTGTGLHGSHLAGAEGGLNQARIVNLKIDTVMKVTEAHGPDLMKHAEQATGFIVRALDNLAETKSGTF